MDENKQKEIASRGGRAAHAQGTAHKFSPEEARLAGRKGGERVSGNREYMARIGRRGGEARHARRLARANAAAAQPQAGSPQTNKNVETDGSNDESSQREREGGGSGGDSNSNVEPISSKEIP